MHKDNGSQDFAGSDGETGAQVIGYIIVKTKYQLRSKVWWPGMDKDVENVCKVCHGCQVTSGYGPSEPISYVLPPSAPWQDCSADLL